MGTEISGLLQSQIHETSSVLDLKIANAIYSYVTCRAHKLSSNIKLSLKIIDNHWHVSRSHQFGAWQWMVPLVCTVDILIMHSVRTHFSLCTMRMSTVLLTL